MKIQELSVGDWMRIKSNDKIIKIAQINGQVEEVRAFGKEHFFDFFGLSDIEPIPLTPEILEENGWRGDKVDPNFWATDGVYIYNHNGVWRLRPKSTELLIVVDIKHVHELQHALRLLGVEKEIEL